MKLGKKVLSCFALVAAIGLNVCPVFAGVNAMDRVSRDAEMLGQCFLRNSSGPLGTNLKNLLIRQFRGIDCVAASDATGMCSRSIAITGGNSPFV